MNRLPLSLNHLGTGDWARTRFRPHLDAELSEVELEWQWRTGNGSRGQYLSDCIGEAERDRLSVAVDAGVIIELCKSQHVAKYGLNLRPTTAYID